MSTPNASISNANASATPSSSGTTASPDTMKDTGHGTITKPVCKASDCPLKQNNIPHTIGLYIDPVERPLPHTPSSLFGSSNPPPFIWEANKRYAISLDLEAQARKRGWARKADDIKKSGEEQGMMVARFLDRHCGCSQSGKAGHRHGLAFVKHSVGVDKMMAGVFGNLR